MFLNKPVQPKTFFIKVSVHEPTLPMMRCRVEEATEDRNGEVDLRLIGDTLFTADETGSLFSEMFAGLLDESIDARFVVMRDRVSEHMTQKRRSGFKSFWEKIIS